MQMSQPATRTTRVTRATRIALLATVAAMVTAIGASACLTGCGQKGNLYLPNQKKKVPTTTSQPDTPPTPPAPISH
jgi:predicted small lipoprotein YifL